jgi:hypothetical protein
VAYHVHPAPVQDIRWNDDTHVREQLMKGMRGRETRELVAAEVEDL